MLQHKERELIGHERKKGEREEMRRCNTRRESSASVGEEEPRETKGQLSVQVLYLHVFVVFVLCWFVF